MSEKTGDKNMGILHKIFQNEMEIHSDLDNFNVVRLINVDLRED